MSTDTSHYTNYESPSKRQQELENSFWRHRNKVKEQQGILAQEDLNRQHQSMNTSPKQTPNNIKTQFWCLFDNEELVPMKGRKMELTGVIKPRLKCPLCNSFYEKTFSNGNFELVDGTGLAIKTVWGEE